MNKTLNKLKAVCPHCQHHFFRFKTEKGIKFCPHCHISLIVDARETYSNNKKYRILKKTEVKNMILAYLVGFLISYWFIHFDSSTSSTNTTNDYLVIVVPLLLIACIILTKFFNKKEKLIIGIDDLNDVKKDLGEYTADQCPNCKSYRMQELYFYKKNLAQNLIKVDIPYLVKETQINSFIGCLHCYAPYVKAYKFPEKIYSMNSKLFEALTHMSFIPIFMIAFTLSISNVILDVMKNLPLSQMVIADLSNAILLTTSIFTYVYIRFLADNLLVTESIESINKSNSTFEIIK